MGRGRGGWWAGRPAGDGTRPATKAKFDWLPLLRGGGNRCPIPDFFIKSAVGWEGAHVGVGSDKEPHR